MKQYVEHTCEIMCEDNGRRMVGEILAFQDRKFLNVSVDRAIKLEMKWNGQVYESNRTGLTFTTDGPLIKQTSYSRK